MNDKLLSPTNLKISLSQFNDLVIDVLSKHLGIFSSRQACDLTEMADIEIGYDPSELLLTFNFTFHNLPVWSIIASLLTKTEHHLTDQTLIKWKWNFDQLWNVHGIYKIINAFLERNYPNNEFKKTFLLTHLQIINDQQLLIALDSENIRQHFSFLVDDLRQFLSQMFHKPQLVIKSQLITILPTNNHVTVQVDSIKPTTKNTKKLVDPNFLNTFKVWKLETSAVRSFQKPRYLVYLKNDQHFYACRLDSKIIKNKNKLELLAQLPTIQPTFSAQMPSEYRTFADLYLQDFVVVADSVNQKVAGPEKITQLFLHTKASTQDGLFYYEDFAQMAQSLGHDSLAITDWNSVTEYPKVEAAAQKLGIKPIYGVQLEVMNDNIPVVINAEVNQSNINDGTYCVFDIETTGLHGAIDHVIEIAVRRYHQQELINSFKCLIKTPKPLPNKIVTLTGITQTQLDEQGIDINDALVQFKAFIGNDILVAHNGINFDFPFINARLIANGLEPINNCLVDTMQLSRAIFYQERSHNLAALCRRLEVNYDETKAHRADEDVSFLSEAFYQLLVHLNELGISLDQPWSQLQFTDQEMLKEFLKKNFTNAICVYAKNQKGISTIYQLISLAHTEYFLRTPTIPWSRVNQLRANLIVTNSPDRSDLWEAVLMNDQQSFAQLVKKYDYVLIAPPSCFQHEINRGNYSLIDCQKLISNFYQLTIANHKKPIANGIAKYLNHENQIQYNALVHAKMIGGGAHPLYSYYDSNLVLPDYQFKTGLQLEQEFGFLNLDQENFKNFIYYHNKEFVSQINDHLKIIHKKLQPPLLPNGEQKLVDLSHAQLTAKYGLNPDPLILARFNQEIDAIVKHGFSVIYWASHLLVKKSIADGYLVGSRGSVGSSFIAYLIDITEVNPLPPHYYCPKCFYTELHPDFNDSGFDLVPKPCPECNIQLLGDGQNIPFATFIGFNGDKTPDIDLNFSGEYQAQAHNYLRTIFGKEYCFRAGTVSTIAEKTAYGFAKNFLELTNNPGTLGLINWITEQIIDVRRTSGQHPGGILVIPNNLSVYDFTPVNYPADDLTSDWKTTHMAYEYLHDSLLKFDALGHDDPTILKKLHQLTNYDPRMIPNHNPQLLKMFTSCDVIGVNPQQIMNEPTGAIGLPEFGTNFVRKILTDAQPNSFGDLIRISGLSHGTDVWRGNAENLVKKKGIKLNQLITCRDDIMVDLINHQIDPLTAFNIMENVRKGKQIPPDMVPMLKEHGVANWYLESANLIKYMFPKAHAAAYVLMAWRVAYYKFYYPAQFYAAYFSIRSDNFDLETLITNDPKLIEAKYQKIDRDLKSKNAEVRKQVKSKDKNLLVIYEVALEMLARKIQFALIDLNQSAATDFTPINDHQIMIPFIAIDGLGQIAANNIVNERKKGNFTSQEDLVNRVKLSKKIIQKMQELKIINDSKQAIQFSLLDIE